MNNNSNRHSILLEQISYWAKKVGRASARPVLLLWFEIGRASCRERV